MKALTVFTPTYNRAHLLHRLYKSLCSQTNQDFLWMVIDDGSVDETKELVQSWIEENKIQIQYHFKENGGMHTGHNMAYRLIETELNVCVDSDDYMPDDAVEKVLKIWKCRKDKANLAGIIGLDANQKGEIIGNKIPSKLKRGNLIDLYQKHKVKGDKKLVLRTDVVRKYPSYPEFEGEKLVPLGILYLQIGRDYELAYSNEIFCIVEYQEGGSSHTIFKQYKQSPRGFAYARKIQIKYTPYCKKKIINYIHLISSSFFARDYLLAFKGVNATLVFLLYPLGLLLHIYINYKIKKK